MNSTPRQLIQAIGRHSDLGSDELERLMQAEVYRRPPQWYRFIRLALLALGAGFLLAGVVFFFAYNWDGLHKFAKLGIVGGLLAASVIGSLLVKSQPLLHKALLFAASLLTGVLFAVFGQIYQTGANAFDFFLAWTVFCFLWVWVSGFPPLWLAFLVLVNITFGAYADQMGRLWPKSVPFAVLTALNAAVLVVTYARRNVISGVTVPEWVTHTVAIGTVSILTAGIVGGILDSYDAAFPWLLALAVVLFPWAVYQGIRSRSIFLPALVSLSLVVITTTYLIKLSQGYFMSLFISLFVMGSITLVTFLLLSLQKKWNHA